MGGATSGAIMKRSPVEFRATKNVKAWTSSRIHAGAGAAPSSARQAIPIGHTNCSGQNSVGTICACLFGQRVIRSHSMNKASLADKFADKFALIHEYWRPKVVAQLNGQEVKLVKFRGAFPWHHHEWEDEMFLVWRGEMTIECHN
jgi:hypothetical protein